jgi:hypothetical protein
MIGTVAEKPVAPVHDVWFEPVQYRVKVQSFSVLPPEITVRAIDHSRELDRYMSVYRQDVEFRPGNSGGSLSVPPKRFRPRNPDAAPKPENLHRAMLRRKSKLRLTVKELAPNAFITLTSRRILTSLDLAGAAYAEWLRLVRKHYGEPFAAVWVPEWHGGGDHLHLHVAARVPGGLREACSALRFLWHRALCKVSGREIPKAPLRGAESPGNIDINARGLRGKSDLDKANKIARYMSKYLSKDMVLEFGRKAYSRTQNIELAAAAIFWATELDLASARVEALRACGYDPEALPLSTEFAPVGAPVVWIELAAHPPALS